MRPAARWGSPRYSATGPRGPERIQAARSNFNRKRIPERAPCVTRGPVPAGTGPQPSGLPATLAEAGASLDLLSSGRFELGYAVVYLPGPCAGR